MLFCLGHRFFLSFPPFARNSLFAMLWWEGGSCGPWPSRGHSTQHGGTSCILCCFLLLLSLLFLPFPPFFGLNEAALSSSCLPSGAERIRVQPHQSTGASAYELFVLPLLSGSWEANLLIVCVMTFGWQPQRGRNQRPDDDNVIILGFNYEGCAGI